MKAAAITMSGVHEPVSEVLPGVLKWTARAAADGADVILFPELILGHYLEAPISIDGPEVSEVGRLAEQLQVSIGIGVGEICGDARYSSYVMFDRDRDLAVHRKTRWQTTNCPINLGRKAESHVLAGVNVGIMICSECRFPDVAEELRADGAALLIVPQASGRGIVPETHGPTISQIWENELVPRAREVKRPAIAVAATGTYELELEGGLRRDVFDGGCALVDQRGEFVYRELSDVEEIHTFWIEPGDAVQISAQPIAPADPEEHRDR